VEGDAVAVENAKKKFREQTTSTLERDFLKFRELGASHDRQLGR